jgi:hypothetical protein
LKEPRGSAFFTFQGPVSGEGALCRVFPLLEGVGHLCNPSHASISLFSSCWPPLRALECRLALLRTMSLCVCGSARMCGCGMQFYARASKPHDGSHHASVERWACGRGAWRVLARVVTLLSTVARDRSWRFNHGDGGLCYHSAHSILPLPHALSLPCPAWVCME